MLRVSVFKLLLWIAVAVQGADWNYGNSSEWEGICQTGVEQSPINFVQRHAAERIYSSFVFTNYDISGPAKVKNNGHTVIIHLQGTTTPRLSGGGLVGEYVFHSFHFHWQSEHTINGKRFPLEMHLVHYNTDYQTFDDAIAERNGVAVLGVLFDVSLDDDKDFIPLIEVMDKVSHYPDTEVDLERKIMAKSFLPRNTGDYYRYMGSMTTPPCTEGVIWSVLEQTLPISADQVKHFEAVWSTSGILTLNYRPVQLVHNREVTLRSSRVRSNSTATITSSVILVALATLLISVKNRIL